MRARRTIVVLVITAVIATLAAVAHQAILRATGALLVADDAHLIKMSEVDVVIVAPGAGTAGGLEAADLVEAGQSRRVALFVEPIEAADQELSRRGVSALDSAARSKRQLTALGVENIEVISPAVEGSDEAARVLPLWLAERGFRSAIVVATSDHSRRLRRQLRRSVKDSRATVFVQPAKYSAFDPEDWWLGRIGLRTGIVELQKLLLDIARHPIS